MNILSTGTAVLIPWLLGLAIISIILKKQPTSAIERSGLAFGVGIGLITLIMFMLNLFQISLNFPFLLFCISLIMLPCLGFAKFAGYPVLPIQSLKNPRLALTHPTAPRQIFRRLEYGLLFLICVKVFYVFFESLVKPVMDCDALWRHSLIAKAIFLDKTFQAPFTLTLIKDNPPFVSFAQAWVFFCSQSWNECLGKIIFPCLFLSLLMVFYANLRKSFSLLSALTYTFLLSALPFLALHATTAYADFPQTYFYSIGTLYLFIFIKDNFRLPSNLIISALFLGMGIFVKRHGFYLAGIDTLVLAAACLFQPKLKGAKLIQLKSILLPFIAILVVISFPWLYFNHVNLIAGTQNIAQTLVAQPNLTIQENLPPLPARFSDALNIFFQKMFFFGNWHLAWALFVLCTIFFFKKIFRPPLVYLWCLVMLNLLYVFIALTFLPAFRFLLDGTLMNRVMLYQMPLVILCCAFASLQEKEQT
ncbi:MAG: hypothetical protein WC901_07015 [Candidatus Margulisiibacteriota bacterium]